jgi:hypothetical protein
MNRKRRLTSAVGALVAAAIVGGVAYATIPGPGNVYSACMLKSIGTIRLIDKSLPSTNLMSRCTDKEIEISWNQAGQPGPPGPQGAKGDPGTPGTNGTNGTNGKDGVSVTTASEPAGANCADGGVQLTAVNGVSYVCNGARGADGEDAAGGGLSAIEDLDGLPCTKVGGIPGSTRVTVGAAGEVTIRCAIAAPGHVYWATGGTTIGRAELDGQGANSSFITGASGTIAVAVDAGHIYWSNLITGTIGRADLDGQNANQSFITFDGTPIGMAVDAGHVYWAHGGSSIGRADLDGQNANLSFITGASGAGGLAVGAG